jgi:hypothetical protein
VREPFANAGVACLANFASFRLLRGGPFRGTPIGNVGLRPTIGNLGLLEILSPASPRPCCPSGRRLELIRERGISWTAIGKALGISRQAAWERFTRASHAKAIGTTG